MLVLSFSRGVVSAPSVSREGIVATHSCDVKTCM